MTEKKDEEKVEKAEEKVTEDELLKAITSLEQIVKARPEPEEEEEEDKKEEEEEEKSFTGNFEQDETLEKAIEVSDFLSALVDQTENSIAALGATVARLEKSMTKFDEFQITALKEVGNVVKSSGESLTAKLDGFDKRLEVMENMPARGAKSIIKSAQVIEKSFAGGGETGIDALPKRKVLDMMEKAVGKGKLQDSKLFAYESANILSEDTKNILKSYL